MPVQIGSIILPTSWVLGTEVETLNDIAEHTSLEVHVEHLQEKVVMVTMVEIVTVGIPGNLHLWIELSPSLSTDTTAYWAAIGGGGGGIAPLAPMIVVPTGVLGTVHAVTLPWSIHSPYARLVAQVPVAAGPTTDYWTIQAGLGGKG